MNMSRKKKRSKNEHAIRIVCRNKILTTLEMEKHIIAVVFPLIALQNYREICIKKFTIRKKIIRTRVL